MARFRGTVQGSRGEASRLGSKSGLTVWADGWEVGVRVEAHDTFDGADVFYVYATGGSNVGGSSRLIAVVNGDRTVSYPEGD